MKRLSRSLAVVLALCLGVLQPLQASGFRGVAAAPQTFSLQAAPARALPAALPTAAATVSLPAALGATASFAALPASAIGAGPAAAGPAAAVSEAARPSPLSQLQRAAEPARPPEAAARQFDGTAKMAPAAGGGSGLEGGSSPAGGLGTPGQPSGLSPSRPRVTPPPAPVKRPNWLKRLNEATRPTSRSELWLERSLALGLFASLATPVLWEAAPFHTLSMTGPLALALPGTVFALVTSYRIARYLLGRATQPPQRGPPRGRRYLAAAMLGLALGVSLGSAPTVFHGPIVERVEAVRSPEEQVRLIRGTAIESELLALLSANPAGREILDQLRDRGGQVRLPPFFVSKQENSIASHSAIYDSVNIAESEIISRGWTVREFMASPEKQRQLVRQFQGVLAHELTHAAQARRSPLEPGQYKNTMEYEYEAYINEHFYVHAQLQADPKADVGDQMDNYEAMIANLDGHLKAYDTHAAYKDNVHLDSPRYRKLFAKLHAGWPAHRLQAYALLAQRHADNPDQVEQYRKAAEEAARQSGLPLPPSLAQ